MKPETMRIMFFSGYAGNPKCEITFDDGNKWYILELKHVEDLLLDAINARGFTLSKTNRQKYERVTINK